MRSINPGAYNLEGCCPWLEIAELTLGYLSTVFFVPDGKPEHCNPSRGQLVTIWKGVHLEGGLDFAAHNGAPRDFEMEFVLNENIFDEWSKADNGSCAPHGGSIVLDGDDNTFSTWNAEVHLDLDSLKCLLGAEERGLDGKLE